MALSKLTSNDTLKKWREKINELIVDFYQDGQFIDGNDNILDLCNLLLIYYCEGDKGQDDGEVRRGISGLRI